jgi:putative transposase
VLVNEQCASCFRARFRAQSCDEREARHHAIPRLTATAPNQVWSWNISKLATYERGVFVNLYMVLDLYSQSLGRRADSCRPREQCVRQAVLS